MRRLDILILKSFFGPFFLTTIVATFILLVQYMLKYFDDFVGKDLGFAVFGELLFYFSLNMLQVALPLGVLVSSLMTFGNLGEHFELTAIKSAGISLTRVLKPIFFFVVLLSVGAFYFNDYVVPAANLKAYSLLYDIKHKKPALDIKKGVFYSGIPNYSIKANEKYKDNKTLKGVMIYNHERRDGNKRVILADSCRMFTMYDDKFLKLELFDGHYYSEEKAKNNAVDQFQRTSFDRLDMVFSLSSFDLKRTKEELFQNNRQMKNINELSADIDSLLAERSKVLGAMDKSASDFLYHNFRRLKEIEPKDSVIVQDSSTLNASIFPSALVDDLWQSIITDTVKARRITPTNRKTKRAPPPPGELALDLYKMDMADLDSVFGTRRKRNQIVQFALNQARNFKVSITSGKVRYNNLRYESDRYKIEKYKKYSQAFACIVMFLIGAPLGAIIKKGGLGFPVIISIFFFIIYYVLTISSEKWAKAGLVDGQMAVWTADLVLLPIGLFFLRQARIDARLFDADFYLVWIEKMKEKGWIKN